mmetsp:Transcript_35652/g.42957  ORF Transcript_35652/g.42957 Transcript_35652/m.42957 type:complete len:521 (+) Transcript_35652:250-1812(+)|eukprot:CAMPEP_0197864466 /NCGR_PEP_ID=MMETSP1438-20131217/42727_1 /TAXON_ID=1461541 /ORGANISM="Pterosperma sp., Strain CCMP1384" /LENGTH=520 /DNA_ID=CAMNT_0043482723 /DNA_START=242 /DNA_END=1804 /DNA_ORIENTATION=+
MTAISSPLDLFSPSKRPGASKSGRLLVVSYGDPSLVTRDTDFSFRPPALNYAIPGGWGKGLPTVNENLAPSTSKPGLYANVPEATLPDGTLLNMCNTPQIKEMVVAPDYDRFGEKIIGSGSVYTDGQEQVLQRTSSTYFTKKTVGIPVGYTFPPPPPPTPPEETKPVKKTLKTKASSSGPSRAAQGRNSSIPSRASGSVNNRTRSPPARRGRPTTAPARGDEASFKLMSGNKAGLVRGNTVMGLPKEPSYARGGIVSGGRVMGENASTSAPSQIWDDSSSDLGEILPPRKMTVQERLAFLRTTAAFIPTAKTTHLRSAKNATFTDPTTDVHRTPTLAERLALKKSRPMTYFSRFQKDSSLGSSQASNASPSPSLITTSTPDVVGPSEVPSEIGVAKERRATAAIKKPIAGLKGLHSNSRRNSGNSATSLGSGSRRSSSASEELFPTYRSNISSVPSHWSQQNSARLASERQPGIPVTNQPPPGTSSSVSRTPALAMENSATPLVSSRPNSAPPSPERCER